MNSEITLDSYINELASNSPTPGGGNVAALCGVLSAALGTMVCSLTIGKKKYAEVEETVKKLKEQIEEYISSFKLLADEDNRAFDDVMNAFRLPKDSDNEKSSRAKAIETATFHAAEIPAKVISNCDALLPHLVHISKIGNQNSLSDAAVGVALIRTSSEAAFLNVLINCASLPRTEQYLEFSRVTERVYFRIKQKCDEFSEATISHLKVV